VIGDAGQYVGEPGLWIDVVELGGLCRPPNYARSGRFPQIYPSPLRMLRTGTALKLNATDGCQNIPKRRFCE
jgi:hypothetical protein